MTRTRIASLGLGLLLAACANTRGSWSCAADPGVPCRSIADLDGRKRASGEPTPPAIEGAVALRWWSTPASLAGTFEQAPRREPDQIVRVLVAGWTDATGDFHAPSEIYAVVRQGGWGGPPAMIPLTLPKAKAGSSTAAPETDGAPMTPGTATAPDTGEGAP